MTAEQHRILNSILVALLMLAVFAIGKVQQSQEVKMGECEVLLYEAIKSNTYEGKYDD